MNPSLKKFPHMHVNAAVTHRSARGVDTSLSVDSLHIPTGRISLEMVVRMLIEEFDVKPIKKNWERVLIRTASEFARRRSDPY